MALNPSNSSSLEQLALEGLIDYFVPSFYRDFVTCPMRVLGSVQ